MKDRDGGPAFPLGAGANVYGRQGMSLRDWFAEQEGWPPQDVIERLRKREHQRMMGDASRIYQERDIERLVVEWRFEMADLMLAEKEKQDGK